MTLVPELSEHMSSSDPAGCLNGRNNCFEEHVCKCSKTSAHDIVVINVGGQVFQTKRSTLQRYPETLLGICFAVFLIFTCTSQLLF